MLPSQAAIKDFGSDKRKPCPNVVGFVYSLQC